VVYPAYYSDPVISTGVGGLSAQTCLPMKSRHAPRLTVRKRVASLRGRLSLQLYVPSWRPEFQQTLRGEGIRKRCVVLLNG
jgi:hypothetical protein